MVNTGNVSVKTVYIIAGCNGAGKTTASYSILPNLCDEWAVFDNPCKPLLIADGKRNRCGRFQ